MGQKKSAFTDRFYLVTTPDEYEMPIGVFDTIKEVGEFLGITDSCVSHIMNRQRKNSPDKLGRKIDRCKYYIYRIDLKEEGE